MKSEADYTEQNMRAPASILEETRNVVVATPEEKAGKTETRKSLKA